MPNASVVMPFFQNARHLRAAIESYLGQTERRFELVLFDDGSTDGSADIARSYRDDRIRHGRHERNRGISAAYNSALALAGGDCFVFAGADDIAEPRRLECTLNLASTHLAGPAVAVSDVIVIDEDGRATGTVYGFPDHVTERNVLIETLKRNYFLGAAMAVFGARDLRLDERLPAGDDFDVALRLLVAGARWFRCPEPLVHYRVHGANFSARHGRMQAGARAALGKYPEAALRARLELEGHAAGEIDLALAVSRLFLGDRDRASELLGRQGLGQLSARPGVERDFYRGVVRCLDGDLEAGLSSFRAAEGLAPENPAVLNNVAALRVRIDHDVEGARRTLERALARAPGYLDARRNLERLEQRPVPELTLTERLLPPTLLWGPSYRLGED